jgi:hypothetical protein
MKHTPGPWKIFNAYDIGEGEIAFTRVGTNETDVLWAGNFSADLVASEANIRLIAAAPDLLEALEMALRAMEGANSTIYWEWNHEDEELTRAEKVARAAIAKAEGES